VTEPTGSIIETGCNRLVKARDGYLIVNINDAYIGKSVIKYGEFSQHELDIFSQLVGKTDNVIEVGANFGTHTVRLCQLASQGKVFAIEPQRIIFQALCGNISLNSVFNCHCIQRACSDIDNQEITIPELDFSKPNNFGGVPMIENSRSPLNDKTISLDTLFSSLDKLRLLKIDAEGMEEKILRGGRKLIQKTRPALYVENDNVEQSESLIREIFSQNYRAYWFISKLYNESNFNGVDENIFGDIHSFNVICYPIEAEVNISGFTEVLDPKYHPLSSKS